ncbi:PREDICTED: uncharacterized protein LOC106629009 [Pseudopodoces humilis]|uniref:uncharacterized protein LOC106629009 n=1 Tax=Pseudopodoces humilis TaxID=181119 RepID=UPI0006B73573|nr:PREDICTED: uncharacterized protein LOC106629009 [Pseudopodoces humilis]
MCARQPGESNVESLEKCAGIRARSSMRVCVILLKNASPTANGCLRDGQRAQRFTGFQRDVFTSCEQREKRTDFLGERAFHRIDRTPPVPWENIPGETSENSFAFPNPKLLVVAGRNLRRGNEFCALNKSHKKTRESPMASGIFLGIENIPVLSSLPLKIREFRAFPTSFGGRLRLLVFPGSASSSGMAAFSRQIPTAIPAFRAGDSGQGFAGKALPPRELRLPLVIPRFIGKILWDCLPTAGFVLGIGFFHP